ncbi:MAG: hypothetical protein AMXMBFR12_00370 [Candidatus Babeliales bacterium]
MNLRCMALTILALNLCHMPLMFADKTHHFHHHHHLSNADKNLLMYGSREELAEGYSQKCDENHRLKNEHWQPKLLLKGIAIGVVLSAAAGTIVWIAKQ